MEEVTDPMVRTDEIADVSPSSAAETCPVVMSAAAPILAGEIGRKRKAMARGESIGPDEEVEVRAGEMAKKIKDAGDVEAEDAAAADVADNSGMVSEVADEDVRTADAPVEAIEVSLALVFPSS